MYYLSTSKVAVAVLANLAFAMCYILYKVMTKVIRLATSSKSCVCCDLARMPWFLSGFYSHFAF